MDFESSKQAQLSDLYLKTGFRICEFNEDDKAIVQAQAAAKGMTEEEAWTWHIMAYKVR